MELKGELVIKKKEAKWGPVNRRCIEICLFFKTNLLFYTNRVANQTISESTKQLVLINNFKNRQPQF